MAGGQFGRFESGDFECSAAYGLHIENGNQPKDDPRGFVKPGYRADLLLLRESPMVEMLNTLKIDRVFKGRLHCEPSDGSPRLRQRGV